MMTFLAGLRHNVSALASVLAVTFLVASGVRAAPFEVTDVEGRTVTLPAPAKRVILGEGRDLFTLSLLSPDPVGLVVGWLADLKRFDPRSYERFHASFPAIAEIPLIGQTTAETFSVEKALALQPDVAILGGGHGPGSRSAEVVRQLEAAGIPVVFTDFRAHPLENTVPSLRLLGQVLGQERKAEAFIALYEQRRALIAERLASADPERPAVLLDMRPSAERPCCLSPGHGNLGAFIEAVGGRNIGAEVIPGALGTLNLEHVIASDPSIYIATGLPAEPDSGRLDVGAGVGAENAHKSLSALIARPGISETAAARSGRAHGLWHNFYNSPLNILALETFARWIHPELFADLDPGATLRILNEQFLAVPLEGAYWVSLE